VIVLRAEVAKMDHDNGEDNFLDESLRELERSHQRTLAANKIAHGREVDFILSFRKSAENEILKVFRAAEEKYGDKLLNIKILDHAMAPGPSVSICFFIQGLYERYKLHLSIDGEPRAEKAVISGKVNGKEEVYYRLDLPDLTQEIVKKSLNKMISGCQ
jgi:hypothetical protein